MARTGRKTKAQLGKELDALRKINTAIGTLLDPGAVLQRIIDEIVPLFAAQAASVILFDYATQEAEITTAYGMRTFHGKSLRYRWRGTLSEWVIEHKRPLRLSRPSENDWPTSARLAEQLGGSLETISVLLAPLWQNGAVIGCLEVVWDPQRDIADGDEQLLEAIATQVTIAIANAKLYREKELALRAAKESEERYRDLVDNSEGLICTHDLDGVILSVNPAAARAFGVQQDELVGRNLVELLAPSVRHFFPAYLAQVRREASVRGSFRVMTRAGEERVLAFHNILRAEPRRDPYVVGHAQDITERVRAESALRASEEKFRQMAENIRQVFWIVDLKTDRFIYVSPAYEEIWGRSCESLYEQPRSWQQDIHPEDQERVRTLLVIQRPEKYDLEFRIIRPDGALRWVWVQGFLVQDKRGENYRRVGIVEDITGQKQAEQALRESEERYRMVSQCISDYAFSFRVEADGTLFLEWMTESFAKVTGYPVRDFFDKSNPGTRYIHPEDIEWIYQILRTLAPGAATTYEFRIVRSDGQVRWIRSYVYRVAGEQGRPGRLYGAAQDITERKRAEETLQHQLAFERLLANLSKNFSNLASEEVEPAILDALRTVSEFSGVERSLLLLFSNNLERMDNTHEWCAAGLEPMQSRLQNLPTSAFPWLMRTIENLEVIHLPTVDQLPPEAQREQEEVRFGGVQSLVSVPIVSGNTPIGFWVMATVRTKKSWAEESILLLKVVGEIIANALERKRAAERQQQLQAQLLQTQKLEAIGTLAGGVAHDFNNILAAIMGYTELVTDDVPEDSLTRRNLEEVLTASRRARKVVQQLLTFSRPSGQERHPVQLHEIVEGTLTLLRASLPKNIDIRLTRRQPTDTILADRTQIEQVVMNLCVNAAHAIGGHDGAIGIGIDLVDKDHATDFVHSDVPGQSFYCLTVKDTGYGMTPAMLKHIFEPFFTTKPVGQGSGMGLAIVHGIVTSHGGSIAVESQLGQGTTFRVYFPPFRETAVADETALASASVS